MPHLTIYYTPNLESKTDMTALCRAMADTMLEQLDEKGQQVFPTGGTRVLAYPAAHYAVADGKRDYAFIYLNLRMGAGRSDATKKIAGDALLARVRSHFEPIFPENYMGITLQLDEGAPAYDGKHSSIHPLFQKQP